MAGTEASEGLEVRALACGRGGRLLFSRLTFQAAPGTLLQLRGRNGSGKTSLLGLLCGLRSARGGELLWQRRSIVAGDPDFARAVALLGHACGLAPELTVRENLRCALALAGSNASEPAREAVLQRLRLAHSGDTRVRQLSQGQRRRLALARVVLSERPLWLLDEPDAGLDPEGEQALAEELAQHTGRGGVAIVASHHALPGAHATLSLDDYAHAGDPAHDRRA